MELISTIISYLGAGVFFIFASVCLASGLYYIADLIEEYNTLARKVLRWTIQGTLVLHALLLIDKIPASVTGISAVAQLSYLRMLRQYPYVEMSSPEFVASAGMLITAQVCWMNFFHDTYHSLEFVLSFFCLMVWLVPFTMFISMSATEATLPGVAAGAGGGGTSRYPIKSPSLSSLAPTSSGSVGQQQQGSGGVGGSGAGAVEKGGGAKPKRGLLLNALGTLQQQAQHVMPQLNKSASASNKDYTV